MKIQRNYYIFRTSINDIDEPRFWCSPNALQSFWPAKTRTRAHACHQNEVYYTASMMFLCSTLKYVFFLLFFRDLKIYIVIYLWLRPSLGVPTLCYTNVWLEPNNKEITKPRCHVHILYISNIGIKEFQKKIPTEKLRKKKLPGKKSPKKIRSLEKESKVALYWGLTKYK